MAKLRAARGKTKVVKAKTKTKVVKAKKAMLAKKIGSFESIYNAAPAGVKKIINDLGEGGDYNKMAKAVIALRKKGYFMDYDLAGQIVKFRKLPAKKVGYRADRTQILTRATPYIKKYQDKGYSRPDAVKKANLDAANLSGYKQTPEIILGRVGAVALLKSLAPEVKLRITRGKKVRTAKITSASDTADILKKFITPAKIQTQEYSFAMYLNNANNVLAVYQFGMGGFTATIMEKRLLMAAALKLGATAMILCHNHPSGNLTPSNADKIITKQISELANIHDIKVLDHVILTREGYYSFANEGLI